MQPCADRHRSPPCNQACYASKAAPCPATAACKSSLSDSATQRRNQDERVRMLSSIVAQALTIAGRLCVILTLVLRFQITDKSDNVVLLPSFSCSKAQTRQCCPSYKRLVASIFENSRLRYPLSLEFLILMRFADLIRKHKLDLHRDQG